MSRGISVIILVLCLHGALGLITNPRYLKSKHLHQSFETAEREVLEEIKARGPELKNNKPVVQDRDLRGTGLRPVENQGGCGSCVAFGSVHTIQDNFRTCGLAKLSTQHVLNCKLSCANGGYISSAYALLKSPGITKESCIRYRATDGFCTKTYITLQFLWITLSINIPQCDDGAWATDFMKADSLCSNSESTLRYWIDLGRPFTIGMGLMYKFYDHGNAVVARDSVYPRATGDARYLGGHAMEVVGYGDLAGVPYWIVKNSWGSGWGDGGFFKLRRKPNAAPNTEYFGSGCRPWHTGYCPVYTDVKTSLEMSAKEAEHDGFRPLSDNDDSGQQTPTEGVKNVTDPDPNAPVPGGGGVLDKNHPLVKEAAYFAVHVLLATPKLEGGYECVPELPIREDANTSISGRSMEEAIAQQEVVQGQSEVTVHSCDQRVVGGSLVHFLFTFTNTDPRCASKNPSGTYDATVYITGDGYFIMQSVFPSAPPPEEEGINVGAVVGGSVAAFVVVAAIGIIGGLRWRATRLRYKNLKDIHQDVINRVDQLEQGPAGDAVRAAALGSTLKSHEDFRAKRGSNPVKIHDRKAKSQEGVAPIPTSSV